jgi:hypothetical protein
VITPTLTSFTTREALLKSARERMNIISAYRQVRSYRGAAEPCGTTHKTVKRVVDRPKAGSSTPRACPGTAQRALALARPARLALDAVKTRGRNRT